MADDRRAVLFSLIGDRIREHRLARGYTCQECAAALGSRHESYWRAIETGHKCLSLPRLVEVADLLGARVSDLVQDL